jgi:hypothetical protein
MTIFKATHPNYTFEKGTSFNMKLLETVVLVNMTGQAADTDFNARPAIPASEDMKQLWQDDSLQVFDHSSRWLKHRGDLIQSKSSGRHLEARIREEEATTSPWSTFQKSHVAGNAQFTLLSVLHRFMALSAEISHIMREDRGDEISDKWIDLALEMMLQSALSLLTPPTQDAPLNPIFSTNGNPPPAPGLKESFAFGYLHSLPSPPFSASDLLINNMFASTTDSNTPIENPAWTTARASFLAEFRLSSPTLTLKASSSSAPINPAPFLTRLAKLKHKYPFPAFRQNLFRCLEHFFIINMNLHGKPVLVQIEEGTLEGMEEEEFEGFLRRVGLVRDEEGRIDFGFGVGRGTEMSGQWGADGGLVDGRYGEMGSLSETFRREGGRGKG